MNYLIWTHDPCPEGGWHIARTCESLERATELAKAIHEEEKIRIEEIRNDKDYPNPNYDG